jgi:membrane protein implicated in regulation of membrane protease activity
MKRSQPSSPASAPSETQENAGKSDSIADAFARVHRHWREVREYFHHYVSVQIDRVLLSVKWLIASLVLGTLAMIGICALLVTAAVQICLGLSHLLTVAFGGRPWLGELVTGLIVWVAVSILVYVGLWRLRRKSRRTTLEKYEQRQAQQRVDFGHDVHERAER